MKGVVILWTKDAHETKSYVRTQHSFTLYPGVYLVLIISARHEYNSLFWAFIRARNTIKFVRYFIHFVLIIITVHSFIIFARAQ